MEGRVVNPGEPQALVSLYHEPLPALEAAETTVLGGVVSSDPPAQHEPLPGHA